MKAVLYEHNELNFSAWDALVESSAQGSVFAKSWYINAIMPAWQGIVVTDDNSELQAVMPLNIRNKLFLYHALQPILAKYWGILFANKSFTNFYEEYSWKKKVVEAVLSAIPGYLVKFHYNFHPNFDYPLPFYWNQFEAHTKFTYILPLKNASGFDVESNFSKSVRKKINKAQRNEIFIKEESSADLLVKILEANAMNGKEILPAPYYPLMKRVHRICDENNSCFMLSAFDAAGNGVASALFLFDSHTTYFLAGFVLPEYRQSAAMPLLVTEALKKASENTLQFDFLGSMMESIESFFRSFGPKPVPYLAFERKKISFLPFF